MFFFLFVGLATRVRCTLNRPLPFMGKHGRTRKVQNKKQRRVFRRKLERLGDEGTRGELQKGLIGSKEQFRKLLRSVGDGNVHVRVAGGRVIGG